MAFLVFTLVLLGSLIVASVAADTLPGAAFGGAPFRVSNEQLRQGWKQRRWHLITSANVTAPAGRSRAGNPQPFVSRRQAKGLAADVIDQAAASPDRYTNVTSQNRTFLALQTFSQFVEASVRIAAAEPDPSGPQQVLRSFLFSNSTNYGRRRGTRTIPFAPQTRRMRVKGFVLPGQAIHTCYSQGALVQTFQQNAKLVCHADEVYYPDVKTRYEEELVPLFEQWISQNFFRLPEEVAAGEGGVAVDRRFGTCDALMPGLIPRNHHATVRGSVGPEQASSYDFPLDAVSGQPVLSRDLFPNKTYSPLNYFFTASGNMTAGNGTSRLVSAASNTETPTRDYDLIFYITPMASLFYIDSIPCQFHPVSRRPTVFQLNIDPTTLQTSFGHPGSDYFVRTLQHRYIMQEVVQALGLKNFFFDLDPTYFTVPPKVPSPQSAASPWDQRPRSDVFETYQRPEGVTTSRLISQPLIDYMAYHFRCPSPQGADLEFMQDYLYQIRNNNFAGRTFSFEVSSTDQLDVLITNLSFSAIRSSGWYELDYNNIYLEPNGFGKDAGCAFLTNTCKNVPYQQLPLGGIDGAVGVYFENSTYVIACPYDARDLVAAASRAVRGSFYSNATLRQNSFCFLQAQKMCDSQHRSESTCNVGLWSQNLPPQMQYFSNANLGGVYIDTAFCPTIDQSPLPCTSRIYAPYDDVFCFDAVIPTTIRVSWGRSNFTLQYYTNITYYRKNGTDCFRAMSCNFFRQTFDVVRYISSPTSGGGRFATVFTCTESPSSYLDPDIFSVGSYLYACPAFDTVCGWHFQESFHILPTVQTLPYANVSGVGESEMGMDILDNLFIGLDVQLLTRTAPPLAGGGPGGNLTEQIIDSIGQQAPILFRDWLIAEGIEIVTAANNPSAPGHLLEIRKLRYSVTFSVLQNATVPLAGMFVLSMPVASRLSCAHRLPSLADFIANAPWISDPFLGATTNRSKAIQFFSLQNQSSPAQKEAQGDVIGVLVPPGVLSTNVQWTTPEFFCDYNMSWLNETGDIGSGSRMSSVFSGDPGMYERAALYSIFPIVTSVDSTTGQYRADFTSENYDLLQDALSPFATLQNVSALLDRLLSRSLFPTNTSKPSLPVDVDPAALFFVDEVASKVAFNPPGDDIAPLLPLLLNNGYSVFQQSTAGSGGVCNGGSTAHAASISSFGLPVVNATLLDGSLCSPSSLGKQLLAWRAAMQGNVTGSPRSLLVSVSPQKDVGWAAENVALTIRIATTSGASSATLSSFLLALQLDVASIIGPDLLDACSRSSGGNNWTVSDVLSMAQSNITNAFLLQYTGTSTPLQYLISSALYDAIIEDDGTSPTAQQYLYAQQNRRSFSSLIPDSLPVAVLGENCTGPTTSSSRIGSVVLEGDVWFVENIVANVSAPCGATLPRFAALPVIALYLPVGWSCAGVNFNISGFAYTSLNASLVGRSPQWNAAANGFFPSQSLPFLNQSTTFRLAPIVGAVFAAPSSANEYFPFLATSPSLRVSRGWSLVSTLADPGAVPFVVAPLVGSSTCSTCTVPFYFQFTLDYAQFLPSFNTSTIPADPGDFVDGLRVGDVITLRFDDTQYRRDAMVRHPSTNISTVLTSCPGLSLEGIWEFQQVRIRVASALAPTNWTGVLGAAADTTSWSYAGGEYFCRPFKNQFGFWLDGFVRPSTPTNAIPFPLLMIYRERQLPLASSASVRNNANHAYAGRTLALIRNSNAYVWTQSSPQCSGNGILSSQGCKCFAGYGGSSCQVCRDSLLSNCASFCDQENIIVGFKRPTRVVRQACRAAGGLLEPSDACRCYCNGTLCLNDLPSVTPTLVDTSSPGPASTTGTPTSVMTFSPTPCTPSLSTSSPGSASSMPSTTVLSTTQSPSGAGSSTTLSPRLSVTPATTQVTTMSTTNAPTGTFDPQTNSMTSSVVQSTAIAPTATASTTQPLQSGSPPPSPTAAIPCTNAPSGITSSPMAPPSTTQVAPTPQVPTATSLPPGTAVTSSPQPGGVTTSVPNSRTPAPFPVSSIPQPMTPRPRRTRTLSKSIPTPPPTPFPPTPNPTPVPPGQTVLPALIATSLVSASGQVLDGAAAVNIADVSRGLRLVFSISNDVFQRLLCENRSALLQKTRAVFGSRSDVSLVVADAFCSPTFSSLTVIFAPMQFAQPLPSFSYVPLCVFYGVPSGANASQQHGNGTVIRVSRSGTSFGYATDIQLTSSLASMMAGVSYYGGQKGASMISGAAASPVILLDNVLLLVLQPTGDALLLTITRARQAHLGLLTTQIVLSLFHSPFAVLETSVVFLLSLYSPRSRNACLDTLDTTLPAFPTTLFSGIVSWSTAVVAAPISIGRGTSYYASASFYSSQLFGNLITLVAGLVGASVIFFPMILLQPNANRLWIANLPLLTASFFWTPLLFTMLAACFENVFASSGNITASFVVAVLVLLFGEVVSAVFYVVMYPRLDATYISVESLVSFRRGVDEKIHRQEEQLTKRAGRGGGDANNPHGIDESFLVQITAQDDPRKAYDAIENVRGLAKTKSKLAVLRFFGLLIPATKFVARRLPVSLLPNGYWTRLLSTETSVFVSLFAPFQRSPVMVLYGLGNPFSLLRMRIALLALILAATGIVTACPLATADSYALPEVAAVVLFTLVNVSWSAFVIFVQPLRSNMHRTHSVLSALGTSIVFISFFIEGEGRISGLATSAWLSDSSSITSAWRTFSVTFLIVFDSLMVLTNLLLVVELYLVDPLVEHLDIAAANEVHQQRSLSSYFTRARGLQQLLTSQEAAGEGHDRRGEENEIEMQHQHQPPASASKLTSGRSNLLGATLREELDSIYVPPPVPMSSKQQLAHHSLEEDIDAILGRPKEREPVGSTWYEEAEDDDHAPVNPLGPAPPNKKGGGKAAAARGKAASPKRGSSSVLPQRKEGEAASSATAVVNVDQIPVEIETVVASAAAAALASRLRKKATDEFFFDSDDWNR